MMVRRRRQKMLHRELRFGVRGFFHTELTQTEPTSSFNQWQAVSGGLLLL
ncbi:hypothetical protein GBA52_004438 [Prunus armeniaca]|nr:hypothetical protein GBA52_004438 [Prunus armeniaca]